MNNNYEELNHEKLINLARGGDELAIGLLFREYRDIIRAKANLYFLAGGEHEDLVQEGMIGLFRAIMYYDSSEEASFATYAELLIARQMIAAVRAAARKKHMPLNKALSLDASTGTDTGAMSGEPDDSINLGDTLRDDSESPEELLLAKDKIRSIEEESILLFSKLELDVWNEYRKGMSYTEISKILGKSPKAIDNAFQRMRRKVAKALAEL